MSPTRFLLALALISCLSFSVAEESRIEEVTSEPPCSKSCEEQNCDNINIRYGKYCGVGHGGCPGEAPCDPLDKCCRAHDKCAMKHGVQAVHCHTKFKTCMEKVQKNGTLGFSETCPYSVAIPTMMNGMDLAIMMSQFAGFGAGL